MPPVDIQLALQGGGAKLFALIAALEELHKAVLARKIRITRIAGTSAGAIIGSLYAAGVDPLTIRAKFAGVQLQGILSQDRPPGFFASMQLVRRLLKGHPLADDKVISDLLEDLLEQQLHLTGRVSLKDLTIPLILVAADVSQRQAITYDSSNAGDKNRDVVACVMDSCAIPFFFRGPSQGSQTLILDGGLAENLPTDLLVAEKEKYGRVVAVSFFDRTRSTPQTPISLAAALLDTAISSSVAKAKTRGNLSVIELDPYKVGTFDFRRAQEILRDRSSEYDNALSRTRDAISEIVSSKGKVVSNTRWESSDPVTMDQILKIYRKQEAPHSFKYFTVRLRVVAYSLLQEGDEDFGISDTVEKTQEFAPSHESIGSILDYINIDADQKPSNVYTEVFDDQSGDLVPFEPLPVKVIDKPTYGLLVFFTPSLAPGTAARYRMQTVFRVPRLFPGLLAPAPALERMAQTVQRADGLTDRVELVLYVPTKFRDLSVRPIPGSPTLQPIPQKELPLEGQFKVFGWRAEGVARGVKVGIEMS